MKQNLQPGGQLDMLTKDELSDAMGHKFDVFLRDLYRGIDFMELTGNNPTALNPVSVALMESGYTWSLRMVSVQTTAACQVSVYPSENINVAPIATFATVANGTNFDGVYLWSSEAAVYKDQRSMTLLCSTGNVINFRFKGKQVPTEMQGKL
jgi:hypothetical protein